MSIWAIVVQAFAAFLGGFLGVWIVFALDGWLDKRRRRRNFQYKQERTQ